MDNVIVIDRDIYIDQPFTPTGYMGIGGGSNSTFSTTSTLSISTATRSDHFSQTAARAKQRQTTAETGQAVQPTPYSRGSNHPASHQLKLYYYIIMLHNTIV